MTSSVIAQTQHSLEPPCGLPSPFSGRNTTTTLPASAQGLDSGGEEPDTLISCMSHLSVSALAQPDSPELGGRAKGSLWGSMRINRALSGLFNEYFDPAEEVLPEQIVTEVGCSAVLDQLFQTLIDEGEAVLIAAPYYSGFDRDLIPQSGIRLVPVNVGEGDSAFSPTCLEAFEAAYADLADNGITTRAVIVCNPQNPLGRTCSRETLLQYARFCEEKDLHLVSDEIYALSTYTHPGLPDAEKFTSLLSLDVEKELGINFDKARIHVVYEMSKDFCANGSRVGALVSQHNPVLLRAMASTSMLMKISSPADAPHGFTVRGDNTNLERRLDGLLQDRKGKGRYRQLREHNPDSTLVDFSSNDYLSLTDSASLRSTFLHNLQNSPRILGSTGSRLLSGSTSEHTALENRFRQFFDSPSALLFNSGWDANVSFFATVPQPGDWVIYDELIHASVHSGLRGSRVDPKRRLAFRHNDPHGLGEVLSRIDGQGTVFLAVESLYSMDGDFAPLPALLDVVDKYVERERQCVVVDEAHSTGVYGSQGRGTTHALGEQGRVGIRLMTFGKAVGSSGAVLLCPPAVRSFLINFARPFIFSTAISHTSLIALHSAWDILQSQEGDQRRKDLSSIITHFHDLLDPVLKRTPANVLRYPTDHSAKPFPRGLSIETKPPAPIVGLLTSTPHALSTFLLEKGFIVRPVVPPTVPPGEERVRVCLRAGIERDVIKSLVGAIEEWTKLLFQNTQTRDALRAKL